MSTKKAKPKLTATKKKPTKPTLTVWITKYALTTGIVRVRAELCSEDMIKVSRGSGYVPQFFHGEGREWHRTEVAAQNRARELARKKKAALEKQMKKMERIAQDGAQVVEW